MSADSRRGFLRRLASLLLISGGAALLAVDPIYAAIERHKAAVKASDAGQGDDEMGHLTHLETEIRYDMHEVVPQTIAGLCAYVAYWAEYTSTDDWLTEEGWEAIPTIAEAMAALFPSGAVA